jgi:hypothetical protein
MRLPTARPVLLALLGLTVLDLLRVGSTLLEARPLPAPAPAAAWLRAQPGLFRVYSPSYSLPPGDGLQHLDGVDPLQFAAATAAIERAIGIPSAGYSVTLPPFSTADLANEHAAATPDPAALARLNVRYVAAEFPLAVPGLALAETFGTTRVYANTLPAERVWVDGQGHAVLTSWSPNRIVVSATGPGTVVLSEVAYPGWRVTLDGQPAPGLTVDGLWRAAAVPAGEHTLVFEYRPASVYTGLALAVAGLLLLASSLWRQPPLKNSSVVPEEPRPEGTPSPAALFCGGRGRGMGARRGLSQQPDFASSQPRRRP